VRSDVVDRSGRVPGHEQLVGNIDEAQWTDKDKEQVPESGDSPRVAGCAHVPSAERRVSLRCNPFSPAAIRSLRAARYSLSKRRTQMREVAGFPKCMVCPSDRKVIVSSYSRFKTSTLVEGRSRKPSKNSKNCASFS
jgi:hypothetical protein